MKNIEIALIFYKIADILEMLGIEWKPIAYRRAARVIETMSKDIETIYNKDGLKGLMQISSIGKALAKKIEEYILTDKIKEYELLKKQIPKGFEDLLYVQGIGPKKVYKLFRKLKIDNIQKLENAAKKGLIRKLEGFGDKSEQEILKSIEIFKKGQERMLLGKALPIAREIESSLEKLKEVKKVVIAGSVRRMKETIKDIDILVISSNPKKVVNTFTTMPNVERVLAKGETKSSIVLKQGINSDLRVLEEKSFGAGLNYFTGSKDHNVELRRIAITKGLKLSEYGLFNAKNGRYVCGRTEQDVYKKLGLSYVAPELRENLGEIQAAKKSKLPKLIDYDSLNGDLHMHTKWSDGANTTEEMINACINLDYKYIAITDHSKSEYVANGLDEKRLLKHCQEIDELQKKYPQIRVLKGAEVDILSDGKLDYSDKILKKLDIVIASIHSRFKSQKEEMTKRIIKALENKYVNIFSHPTGRLINEREPYEVDIEKLFETARENNVFLEINSFPSRLDLKDINIKLALEHEVKFAINSDSHSTEHLKYIELGIAQARRGWLESKDILNTLSKQKVEKILQSKR